MFPQGPFTAPRRREALRTPMAQGELGCAQGKSASLRRKWHHASVHQELRPQDSIPFLRRVSTDLQKTDIAKVLANIDSPIDEAPPPEPPAREEPSVLQQSFPFGSISPLPDDTQFSPRDHTFVKTIFGKRKQPFHLRHYSTQRTSGSDDLPSVFWEREEERGYLRSVQPHSSRKMRARRGADL